MAAPVTAAFWRGGPGNLHSAPLAFWSGLAQEPSRLANPTKPKELLPTQSHLNSSLECMNEGGLPFSYEWIESKPDEPTYRNKDWSVSSSLQKQGYTEGDAPPSPTILKSLLSQYCTQQKYKGSLRSHEILLQVIRLRQWSERSSF